MRILTGSIGSIHHCECNYVPGILQVGEIADVAGLIALRPFCAVQGKLDKIFPIEESRKHSVTWGKYIRLPGYLKIVNYAKGRKVTVIIKTESARLYENICLKIRINLVA